MEYRQKLQKLSEEYESLQQFRTDLVRVLLEEAQRRETWEAAVERELRNLNPGMGDLV